MKIRTDRAITSRGNYGMDIQLKDMRNTPSVVWINGNSYVTDGNKVISVNGIGEIRWSVEDWNRDTASRQAIAYFFEE